MTSLVVEWRAVSLTEDFFLRVEISSSREAIWVSLAVVSSTAVGIVANCWMPLLPGWLMAANSARPSSIIAWGKKACVRASENSSVFVDDGEGRM